MEGISGEKKMVVSLMMLMMVVTAQCRVPTELAAADVHPTGSTGACVAKCLPKCLPYLFPQRIAVCFGLCMIGCKLNPPPGVMECTTGCAHTMSKAYNSKTDSERVESFVNLEAQGHFVDSCYESCKHEYKN